MNVALDRTNTYPNKCFRCGARVPAMRGFLLRRSLLADPSIPGKGEWLTLCNSRPCAASVVGEATVDGADRLAILADGTIVKPAGDELLPYLRAIGSWDGASQCWRASPHRRDRDHVIEVATKLGFEIAPEYAAYEDPKPVRDAVARARAGEYSREYQIEGTRRLAYVGIDDAEGCFDTPRFNLRDRVRGFVEADDQGLGKSKMTLEAVHDDEALVVVCNSAAKAVWPREAKKFRPDRWDTFTIYEGEESFEWPTNPREMVVINYDILRSTPALIRDEIEHLNAKLHGWLGNADDRVKWKRKSIAGAKPPMDAQAAIVDALAQRCAEPYTTTALRHAHYLALVELEPLHATVHRLGLALKRASNRKPIGAPSCPILLVGDELHYVENHKAKRSKKWRHLASYARRVIGLTGTPVESEPFKLWGLLTSACANPFASWPGFLKQFNAFELPHGGYDFLRHPPLLGSTAKGSVIVEPGTTEQVRRVLLRRTKEEVLPELPPKTFSEIPVEITAKVRKELDEITAVYAPELLEGDLPPFAALSATLKALASACIPTLIGLVETYEATDTPVVVFSANRSPVEALMKRDGWFGILGGKGDDPGTVQDRFQAGEGIGVAGTQAAAESLTLTRASTVIQVIPFLARKKNQQAYDRLHRIGQHDAVHVILLVPDHVLVRHIFALLVAKDQFVADVLTSTTTPARPASRFNDETLEQWEARTAAKRRADAERDEQQHTRELVKRERELSELAGHDVTPKISEARARARAEHLGDDVLHHGADAKVVTDALDFMLARCDGAVLKDDAGFNRPDGCVARWLAPGVGKGSKYAVASAAAILRKYPRQLASRWPSLFA